MSEPAKPSTCVFSSMGIVINKIQRDEKPRSKILPEEVRQAPSTLESRPRALKEPQLPHIPTFHELTQRKSDRPPSDSVQEAP